MLTLVDLKGMCDCTDEEIEAIAMHEQIPDSVASEMASYLIHEPDGVPRIRRIIMDDIEYAESKGNKEKAENLRLVLLHFIASHPDFTSGGFRH